MENSEENYRITLDVTKEQSETIHALFNHNDWNYCEINRVPLNEKHDQIEEVVQHDSFVINQDMNQTECKYCFCRPCITDNSNRQLWWET